MKVLVTGVTGQLGHELKRTLPPHIEWIGLDRHAIDLTNLDALEPLVTQLRPAWIINAAAYTQVERAESDRDIAFLVNAKAPELLAQAATAIGARLLQVSTDFIFDGTQGAPYVPDAEARPLNVYGESKWLGEQAVRRICGAEALLVRTAWVYSNHGRNFVRTIIEAARTRDHLNVVCDQVGSPTWAYGLARAIWKMVDLDLKGVYHWTDAGVASWYDFALAIVEEAASVGLVPKAIPVVPIGSDAFPSKAKRPSYSVLDKRSTWASLSMTADHWRHTLRAMLQELNDA